MKNLRQKRTFAVRARDFGYECLFQVISEIVFHVAFSLLRLAARGLASLVP